MNNLLCPHCGYEDLAIHSRRPLRYVCGTCDRTTRNPIDGSNPEKFNITKGSVVVTWAQNDTPVFTAGLKSLKTFCEHNDAQLVVIPGRYKNPTSVWTKDQEEGEQWSQEVMPYLNGTRTDINSNLTLCGDVKIQPTATKPLSGLTTLTGAMSCIYGHPQITVESVPTPQSKMAKLCMTTGAITKPNFTDSKAGIKGEFHHQYGACFVQTDGERFYTRQLCIDGSGKFYDLDKCYKGDVVTDGHRAEVFVSGDFHAKFLDEGVKAAWWTGGDALLDLVKPKAQVFHDLFDGYFGSHHHKHDPFLRYKKHVTGDDSGRNEIDETVNHFNDCLICPKNYVVKSNHDEHLDRWLAETDWRKDLINAELYLDLAHQKVLAIQEGREFDSLEYVLSSRCENVTFLKRGDMLVIKDHALNYHGDKGSNGARGSLAGFNKVGVRTIIGHSHSPGRDKGVCQVGLSARYDLEYAIGSPSSWMHTSCLVYPNGQKTLINSIDGKWRK